MNKPNKVYTVKQLQIVYAQCVVYAVKWLVYILGLEILRILKRTFYFFEEKLDVIYQADVILLSYFGPLIATNAFSRTQIIQAR